MILSRFHHMLSLQRSYSKITCSKINSLPPLRQVLCQKVIAIEKVQQQTKDIESRNQFMTSFPELAHYIEDEDLRITLNRLEKETWPRGNTYRDQVRDMSFAEKTWIRMCVVTLLERTKPEPISDEVAAFLEVYLLEKKVL